MTLQNGHRHEGIPVVKKRPNFTGLRRWIHEHLLPCETMVL
jgi:hypothetical protein